jgi:hypothetical protein
MDTPTPSIETELKLKHETFAQGYAIGVSGAEAARIAGYAPSNWSHQASELLRRPEVAARVVGLQGAYRAEQASRRAAAADALMDKLEPVYGAALEAGDFDTAMQSVELQARILGLVHGGATLRPRSGTGGGGKAVQDAEAGHREFLELLGDEKL